MRLSLPALLLAIALLAPGCVRLIEPSAAHLSWADGNEKISENKEAFIEYFRLEHLWRFTGADCEQAT